VPKAMDLGKERRRKNDPHQIRLQEKDAPPRVRFTRNIDPSDADNPCSLSPICKDRRRHIFVK